MKKIILPFLLLFIFTTGFGCKGLTAEQKAAVKPVTLNYWTTYNDLAQLKKFATEYKNLHSYVTINIKQVRAEEFEKLLTNALADDVAPDLVSIPAKEMKKYQARLAEMPPAVKLSAIKVEGQYIKETIVTTEEQKMPTANTIKNSFISTVYNDAVIDGKIYGLPLAVDNLAIYYNKDLLDKAGVAEAPKNWDDFMKAVKAGTKFNDKGEIIQSGVAIGTATNVPRAFDILSMLMMQSGVKMTQGNSVTFASGAESSGSKHPAIAALRFYTDFARPTKEVYTWNEKMGNSFDAFVQGKAVFYFGFGYEYPRLKTQAPQMNLEVMPMLQLNDKQPANVANYWLETVIKKSKNQNEAWGFVAFMASPDNVKKYCTATHRPTPLRSQINAQKEDLSMAPFAEQILNAENWYRGRDAATAEKAFNNLITNYLLSKGTDDQGRQDSDLLLNASRIIQQTM